MHMKMDGLSFKRIDTNEAFVDRSPFIRSMIKRHVEAAGDKFSVDQIMDFMQMSAAEPSFFVLVAMYGDMPVGLLTAYGISSEGVKRGMVHVGYVDDSMHVAGLSKTIISDGMHFLFDWAEDSGYASVLLQTQRNPNAFDRMLGQLGWHRLTTVYEREINHGGRKESSESSDGRSLPEEPIRVGEDSNGDVRPVAPGTPGVVARPS